MVIGSSITRRISGTNAKYTGKAGRDPDGSAQAVRLQDSEHLDGDRGQEHTGQLTVEPAVALHRLR